MQSVTFVLDTEKPKMETEVTNVSHSLLEMLKVFKRQVSLSMQACDVYKRLAAAFQIPLSLTLFSKSVCIWMKMKLYFISQFHITLITFS